jgi:hypothetical protein
VRILSVEARRNLVLFACGSVSFPLSGLLFRLDLDLLASGSMSPFSLERWRMRRTLCD